MVSRYILWEKDPSHLPFADSGTPLLRDAFAALARGRTELSEFSRDTLLAVRQHLADTGMGAEIVLHVVDGIPTLRVASTTPMKEFELSVRSSNCFKAASIETLEDLLDWSPDRLMKLPNFGRKCLDETALLLERLGYGYLEEKRFLRPFQNGLRLKHESAPLACLLDVRELAPAEVVERFSACGWRIVADCATHSARELATMTGMNEAVAAAFQQTLDRLCVRFPVTLPMWFLQHTDSLQSAFQVELEELSAGMTLGQAAAACTKIAVPAKSLQEEFLRLIPSRYNERKRAIVVSLFGLGGEEAATLDEVAVKQVPPMTRERVRQLALPVIDALQEEGRSWPQLVRAVESLQAAAPCLVETAHESLLKQCILESQMSVAAIIRLAQRAGLKVDLEVNGNWLVLLGTTKLLDSLLQAAAKLSSRWGIAYWPAVLASFEKEIPSELTDLLEGVVWLDEAKQYALVPARENSLANRLARILKITPRLRLTEAYQGATRDSRMMNTPLPEEYFGAFCRVWSWCSVEGEEVVAGQGMPSSEVSSDDLLVLILREMGRPARRRELTQEALKHGLKPDAITHALSYSNVIASANGFFAVIGDGSLAEFADGRLQPEPEPLLRTPELVALAQARNGNRLVPDERDPRFAALLMAAVEMRLTALALQPPWSVGELGLSVQDRDSLIAWGRTADWNPAENNGFYELVTKEKVRKSTALGLAFLMFAVEAVRRSEDIGSVWPAIEASLGEAQCKSFLARTGMPKQMLRESVEAACRTFGMRHSFEDVGEVWVRTLGLQFGLQCGHVRRLSKLLSSPDSLKPTAITLLLDETGSNGSESFRQAWRILQDVRRGRLSGTEALARFAANPWLGQFGSEELLRQCRSAEEVHTREHIRGDLPYQYFEPPILAWEGTEPVLEYRLNSLAPAWRISDVLTLLVEDPYRRERLVIAEGRWALREGAVQVRLTQLERPGFRFRLMHGKEAITDDWLEAGAQLDQPFVFFRGSGAMVPHPDDVAVSEELVLLHAASTRLAGLAPGARFQMVLRGAFRLTRLRAGEVAHVILLAATGDTIWSYPQPEAPSLPNTQLCLSVRGGPWGAQVSITLPAIPFVAQSLRLNSGEVLPLLSEGSGAKVRMSPGLAVAEVGYLRGLAGVERRSIHVELRHSGESFGAALEADTGWQTLDGSATLDAAVLRTQRLRAQVVGPEQDVCWMEGSRPLSGLQRWGTTINDVHGLGEELKVVRGTYNVSQLQVFAASAVIDSGFLRSVQSSPAEVWNAALPFEDGFGPEHALWVWEEGRPLPFKVQREHIEKTGFSLRWRYPDVGRVVGWAFSVNGARLGSVMIEDRMRALNGQLNDAPWIDLARWLRWWHAPVHHPTIRSAIAAQVRQTPIATIKAWMMPAGAGMVFDELRNEAWAAAARKFLWRWRPDPTQAADLVISTGIWSGNIEQDSVQTPSVDSIESLARVSPWLLACAVEQSLPVIFPYPKSQLAVLLKLMLKTIDPNSVDVGFRLNDLYDRYARGESRLDGNFIAKTLVSAAKAMAHGQKITDVEENNLRIGLHSTGLRQLLTVALLRDLVGRWERGQA